MATTRQGLLPVLLISTNMLPHAAQADVASLFSETDLFIPVSTVQSVTGLKQRQSETPAATTIIDQRLIQDSGATNIAELLRFVPGFQVYHVNKNKFGVVSHGQGGAHPGRLEVMIDGRSVYLPLLSTVDWSALGITLDDIDYIEVVRGSNVPTQGSNAFLGAINIITKEPFKRPNHKIKVTLGTHHWVNTQFQQSGKLNNLDYGLSGDYLHNHGFGTGYDVDDSSHSTPITMEDGGEITQLSFRGSYTPNLQDSLDISLGLSQGRIGVGTPHRPNGYSDRDLNSHYQSLKWQRLLNDGNELEVHAYHNYLHYDNSLLYHVAADSISAFGTHPAFDVETGVQDGTSERYDLSLKYIQNFDFNNRVLWNGGLRYETLQSEILLDSPHAVEETLYRLATNWEHSANKHWVFNAGAMLEYNETNGANFSPRLGVNYKVDERQSFRAAISRAYRTPSLLEANETLTVYLPDDAAFGIYAGEPFNRISRPYDDLQPEQVKSAEVGYRLQLPQQQSLDARLFYEEVNQAIDQIDLSISDYDNKVREYRNEAYWTAKGIELQLRLQPWPNGQLNLAYSYTQTHGEYPNSNFNSAEGMSPGHTLAALLSQQLAPATRLSLATYAQSAVRWEGAEPTPSYQRWDLHLGHQLAESNNVQLELIIQNLLSDYTEFDLNNNLDTEAYLRFSMEF